MQAKGMVPPTLSRKQRPRAMGRMGPRMPMKGVSLERRQCVISSGKREKGKQRGGTVERWEWRAG